MTILDPRLLRAAVFGLAFVVSPAVFADDTASPAEPQEKSAATESVQPQVDKQSAEAAAERRNKIVTEATAALAETRKALKALGEKNTEGALAALEETTGKLELILAREPSLALAPVDVEVVTYDLLASPDTVKAMIHEAENLLEDGNVQMARPLVANLASEIVFRTTSIPLATYPDAIKAITPLIDAGKLDEAKAELQAALNTLVVTTDDVIPLPTLRAEWLLKKAESLAENKERTVKENETITDVLVEARTQLKMAELLGYGNKKSFQPMYEQIDQIEAKLAGGKGGEGWFDQIKEQLSELI
jgi:predicted negative regulator of RcsB-dependent stress response